MKHPTGSITNTTTGNTLATRILLADTYAARLQGLQFRVPLTTAEALLLIPGSSIHSLFVRAPFDAIFLDRAARVLATTPDIRPWRFRIPAPRHTHAVLETAPGISATLTPGDRLALVGCAAKPRKSLSFLLTETDPAPRTARDPKHARRETE